MRARAHKHTMHTQTHTGNNAGAVASRANWLRDHAVVIFQERTLELDFTTGMMTNKHGAGAACSRPLV